MQTSGWHLGSGRRAGDDAIDSSRRQPVYCNIDVHLRSALRLGYGWRGRNAPTICASSFLFRTLSDADRSAYAGELAHREDERDEVRA